MTRPIPSRRRRCRRFVAPRAFEWDRIVLLVLAAALGMSLSGHALAADRKWGPPVFFKDPDPATKKVIDSDLDLLKQTGISDHTRGREDLEKIGYWAVAPLRARLKKSSTEEQRNAALVLGILRFPGTLSDLLDAAQRNSHQIVQVFSALMAGRFEDPSALGRLDTLVHHSPRDRVRIASLLSMAKIGGPKAADLVEKAAESENHHLVEETGIFCLGFFRSSGLVRGPNGFAPCPILAAALRSPDAYQRRAATLALALLGHPDLKSYYESVVRNGAETDVATRCIGLVALGSFSDPDVTKLFLDTIKSPGTPRELALTAAFMIENRRDPSYLPWLLAANPSDARVRAALTLALSRYRDLRAVKKMTLRLSDRQEVVRAAAAIGLSRVRGAPQKKLAVQRLTDLLQGKSGTLDPNVRYDMKRARALLLYGHAAGRFLWLGNEELVEDLRRSVPRKLIDLANREAARVLGLTSLTDLKTSLSKKGRFRVTDQTSGLRDLDESLKDHPYFTLADLPGVRSATTPNGAPRGAPPSRKSIGDGK